MAVNRNSGIDVQAAVVGAGVVGSATALALARRGVSVALVEAEDEPGTWASGSNSGILHTGFDSAPGELETRLILRSAALRDPVLAALGVEVVRCGAVMRPMADSEPGVVDALARNAAENGVAARIGRDGALEVPGESIADPALFTRALALAAERHGAIPRMRFRAEALRRDGDGLLLTASSGERIRCGAAVNCAGLGADELARSAGDVSFEVYPRKGEFLVFDLPEAQRPDRILLPAPTKRTKGVLVFPTVDGMVVAGPTAVDQEDRTDRTVRPEAADEILPKAVAMHPPLAGAKPVAAYSGLRPAGRGVNYAIGHSAFCPGLVNVAAIRSTGMTAALGIAELACELVAELGVPVGPEQPLVPGGGLDPGEPWWRRAAARATA
jgi:glycerol-3-phosphate dehydrogenase